MLVEERRQLLLDEVRRARSTRVVELARDLGVSEMTVRRDLAVLASEGKLKRVHGGAVPFPIEPSFAVGAEQRLDEKRRIGAAAAALVQDGETILLEIGTTTLEVARHLAGRDVTVVTNNLAVYDVLLEDRSVEIVLLGGVVDRGFRSLLGSIAEASLTQLRADRVFLGASGIGADLSVLDEAVADLRIKRAMIQATSGPVVLVTDSTKFAHGGIRVCGPEELDVVITDTEAPKEMLAAADRAAVEAICV